MNRGPDRMIWKALTTVELLKLKLVQDDPHMVRLRAAKRLYDASTANHPRSHHLRLTHFQQ